MQAVACSSEFKCAKLQLWKIPKALQEAIDVSARISKASFLDDGEDSGYAMLKTLHLRIQDLSKTSEKAAEHLSSLEKQLIESLKATQRKIIDLNANKDRMQGNLNAQEAELRSKEGLVSEFERQASRLEERQSSLRSSLSYRREDKTVKNVVFGILTVGIYNIADAIGDFDGIEEIERDLDRCRSQLRERRDDVADARRRVRSERRRMHSLQVDLSRAESTIRSIERQVKLLGKSKVDVSKVNRGCKNLENKFMTLAKGVEEVSELLDDDDKLEDCQDIKQIAQDEFEELKNELVSVKSLAISSHSSFQEIEKVNAEYQSSVQEIALEGAVEVKCILQ
mmetsp:Transcript_34382/g.83196  ORF Transcript_34382/g.83196 Transcript_34382/m.83196 type:complete len:339 (+) Transcript_34382:134-1150(+)